MRTPACYGLRSSLGEKPCKDSTAERSDHQHSSTKTLSQMHSLDPIHHDAHLDASNTFLFTTTDTSLTLRRDARVRLD